LATVHRLPSTSNVRSERHTLALHRRHATHASAL
jgi:hypothetical protein